jgi:hypothetical protein
MLTAYVFVLAQISRRVTPVQSRKSEHKLGGRANFHARKWHIHLIAHHYRGAHGAQILMRRIAIMTPLS